ncbi:hypothetical protein MBLNU459_g4106t1 [Dothideomycetes sp. NU459]
MLSKYLCALALPLAANAANIISSNDDGWAEINIRTLYNSLTAAGDSVIISSPAENQSGSGETMSNLNKYYGADSLGHEGSSDATPTVLTEACEFDSCPVGSPAEGYNASNTRFNYVNSYPVTAMEYGINTLAPAIFGGAPDLAVAGPNVGSNLGLTVFFSGTVGATTAAVNSDIPGIAFSGQTGDQTAWTASTPLYASVYATLATEVVSQLLVAGAPYLPSGVWLNVNFPASTGDSCSSAADFSFVLSRIHTAVPLVEADDVETCGSSRLPTETDVINTDGCYASISVGKASNKRDASEADQATVLAQLQSILTCLP